MAADTQHFVVSIDEGNSQGVYCAYCGEKIIPARSETGAYYFQCDCEDAAREKELYLEKSKVEQDLESFLIQKTDAMQVNELRTRIVIYEQHIHELKKRLQELMNKVSGAIAPEGVSTLVVKLPRIERLPVVGEEPVELTDEVFLPPLDVEEDVLLEDHPRFFGVPEEEEFDIPILEEAACHDVPMVSAESSASEDEDYEEICEEENAPFFDPRGGLIEEDDSLPSIEDFEFHQ